MIRKLCNVDQLPLKGTLKAFVDDRRDTPMALCVGQIDGVPYAVENVCPHQGAPLSAGHLEGDHVVCPLHAWKWNLRTGVADHAGDPPLASFELRQYGAEVFVRIAGPAAGPALSTPCTGVESAEKKSCRSALPSAIR